MRPCRIEKKWFSAALLETLESYRPQVSAAANALKQKTCKGQEWTGWYNWPKERGLRLAQEISQWKKELTQQYDTVVVIGTGGSYLGARAVSSLLSHEFGLALKGSGQLPQIVFAGHTMSETSLAELLEFLDQRQPLINVISKSGTTTEPGVAFRVLRSYLEKRYGAESASRRIVATTDLHKGALRKLAEENKYKVFEVPSDVGGRFSVLTAVGLVPLALAGVDIESLLHGAQSTFDDFASTQPSRAGQTAIEYALCRTAAWRSGLVIEVLSFHEPRFYFLAEWWKQLFGESEGKDGLGLFPASLSLTTDLHSLGQYMQDGPRSMMETFLAVDNPRRIGRDGIEKRVRVPAGMSALDELDYLEGTGVDDINATALLATKLAHAEGRVPCLELRISQVSEYAIGELLAMFELTCALSAAVLGVNPYDQPGVEAYKLNMFGLLGKPGFENVGAALRAKL